MVTWWKTANRDLVAVQEKSEEAGREKGSEKADVWEEARRAGGQQIG